MRCKYCKGKVKKTDQGLVCTQCQAAQLVEIHRCACQSVPVDSRWPGFRQCTNKGTIEENGKWWCKKHAPSIVQARQDHSQRIYDMESSIRRLNWEQESLEKDLAEKYIEENEDDDQVVHYKAIRTRVAQLKHDLQGLKEKPSKKEDKQTRGYMKLIKDSRT